MKTERNILIAFLLNFGFSIFEFVGGVVTGSTAIISDALHDVGDAASIGVAYLLERKSKKQQVGSRRYSLLGGLIITIALLISSLITIAHAISRLLHPTKINYDGMIIFAIVGVCVNFCAAYVTGNHDHGHGHNHEHCHEQKQIHTHHHHNHVESSLNQKAVNLHMLEDVLGWAVVLVGAIVMKFADVPILDPLMSLGVSIFILINALKNLKEIRKEMKTL